MQPLCAVFIDFENLYYFLLNQRKDLNPNDASLDVVERTRKHLEEQGLRVILGRAYGDFERIPNAMGHLQLMGFEPRFTLAAAHKNSSDIALSLDALEVLLTREEISHFVIMAGDRDYLPIIRRIRERAKDIWVVGFERNTSADLRNVAGRNHFIKADDFLPPIPASLVVEAARIEAESQEPVSDAFLQEEEATCLRLLLDAQNTYKNPEIWLSPFLQNYMNQSFSYLDRFGRRKLIERLESRGLVRIEKRQGNPYDYSVIVLIEDQVKAVLGPNCFAKAEAGTAGAGAGGTPAPGGAPGGLTGGAVANGPAGSGSSPVSTVHPGGPATGPGGPSVSGAGPQGGPLTGTSTPGGSTGSGLTNGANGTHGVTPTSLFSLG